MKAILPYPPSANRYFRVFNGRAVTSAEAKAYKRQVSAILAAAGWKATSGAVAYTAHLYRPQRSGDLDNRLKVLGDALTGHAWLDDKQVVELHAYRHDDKDNPRVEIEVTVLAEGPLASTPPAEAVEGCVTAGCSEEAKAGGLHCPAHDTDNRLKRKPKVQSAYRAAKTMEEALPRGVVHEPVEMVSADHFAAAVELRPSRGVEGELQPLPKKLRPKSGGA